MSRNTGRILGSRAAARVATLALAAWVMGGCGGNAEPAQAPRPVLVVQPGGGDARGALSAFPGEVRAREESPLAFRVGGNLVRRLVDVGDEVQRGQLLAELDPGDLRLQAQAAQAQLAAAEAELARAGAERARFAKLAQQQLVSRSALDAQDAALAAAAGQARAARAQRDVAGNQAAYTQLRAPRAGVIADRSAEAGQTLAAGQPVFTFAAEAGREVAIALPESRVRDFAVGQPVLVEPWGSERRWPGTIREIAPAADPQARTYAARVALAGEAAEAVELGQSARVYVQANGQGPTLRVPLSALQRGNDGRVALWVVDPATRRLRLARVRVGSYGADDVPVLAGVEARDWIVAAGGHLLREGQLVAPVDRENRPVAAATTGK